MTPPKRSKDGDDGSNFHGQVRKNDTHQSTTDPEAKLYRNADGREAKLCYMGHALMENRSGLAVGGMVTQANGTAERRASEALLKKKAKGLRRVTVGEDKADDTSDHVATLRRMSVTPHVAQNDSLTKTGKRRMSAIDARTTRHIGYQISQTCRKMTECIFGWASNTARCAKPNIEASQASPPLHAQSGRLQPDPHSQTAGRLGQRASKPQTSGEDQTHSRSTSNTRVMTQLLGFSVDC
jgi:hypothetical protein